MKTYKQLTFEQRYAIESMLKSGSGKGVIAKSIGVSKSTVYRKVTRNKQPRGTYRAQYAHILADERKREGHYKQKLSDSMISLIKARLKEKWSPEQIVGYCRDQGIAMASHERIYQYIWQDKAHGENLYTHLRNSGKIYKKRYGSKDNRGQIPNKISIDQRPEHVNERQRVGDWEIDLIVGKNHKGAILTAVERKTAFLAMVKTDGKKAHSIKKQLINALAPYKKHVFTITNDNGKEFALHQSYAKNLECDVYFAHPYASWERGLNEYTNKLIRQYLPKNMSLDQVEPAEIQRIALQINNRPRKKLGFEKPQDLFLANFVP